MTTYKIEGTTMRKILTNLLHDAGIAFEWDGEYSCCVTCPTLKRSSANPPSTTQTTSVMRRYASPCLVP